MRALSLLQAKNQGCEEAAAKLVKIAEVKRGQNGIENIWESCCESLKMTDLGIFSSSFHLFTYLTLSVLLPAHFTLSI